MSPTCKRLAQQMLLQIQAESAKVEEKQPVPVFGRLSD
jgi:hypothetical protein